MIKKLYLHRVKPAQSQNGWPKNIQKGLNASHDYLGLGTQKNQRLSQTDQDTCILTLWKTWSSKQHFLKDLQAPSFWNVINRRGKSASSGFLHDNFRAFIKINKYKWNFVKKNIWANIWCNQIIWSKT